MSKRHQQVLRQEINKEIVKAMRHSDIDSDAGVMLVLHREFGFGRKRLMQFWEENFKMRNELASFYEMQGDDLMWLYKRKLQEETGIDIEKLYNEVRADE